ncbi:hypothetical protein JCM5350_000628 [Sporobolomyces pararoseus]
MRVENHVSFKLCSIATLPPIDCPWELPQVRVVGRVVGNKPEEGVVLIADTASSPSPTVVVDFERVVLHGAVSPPKVKDLIMVFGELVPKKLKISNNVPPNELSVLNIQSPDLTKVVVAKRIVRIEEGHGAGFDVRDWAQAVENVQTHLSSR